MTEQEWADSGDPEAMLSYLCTEHRATRSKAGKRKLRLFTCACLRQVWDLITEDATREAVGVCERFADGLATAAELASAAKRGFEREMARRPGLGTDVGNALSYAAGTSFTEVTVNRSRRNACAARCHALKDFPQGIPLNSPEWRTAARAQAELLRDIFGNTVRPVAVDPEWLTSTVVALVRGIDEDQAFDQLPILTDALLDAGCEDERVLGHCRIPGPHVRGCWVIDLLLGRE
jgi:hypothetical protein